MIGLHIILKHKMLFCIVPGLLLLVAYRTALADTPPMSLAAYRQLIADLHQLVAKMPNPPTADTQAQLGTIAGRLSAITALTLPDGTTIPIDHSFLVAQLTASPADIVRIQNLFAALENTLDTQTDLKLDPDSLTQLERILAEPQFRRSENSSKWQEWLNSLNKRILAFLEKLFPKITIDLPNLQSLLTVAGILTLGLVLAYTLRNILGVLVTESELKNEHNSPDKPLTAATAIQQARSFSHHGDYRMAVRYLYLSTLLMMEERGLLRYDRSKTNREYLESLRDHPQLSRTFDNIVQVFDRVWYGYRSIDQETFDQYVEQVTNLQRMRT